MLVSSSNFSASTFPPTLLLTPIISIHSSKDVIIVVKWFSCSIIFYDNLFAVHFITLVSSERSIVYDFIFTSSFPIFFNSSCCFLNISSYQVNMAWIFFSVIFWKNWWWCCNSGVFIIYSGFITGSILCVCGWIHSEEYSCIGLVDWYFCLKVIFLLAVGVIYR